MQKGHAFFTAWGLNVVAIFPIRDVPRAPLPRFGRLAARHPLPSASFHLRQN